MDTFTLAQAYYLAEIIGVFAIILSLVYVGRQLKQNTKATKIAASQAFVQMYNTFTSDLAGSHEIADIWYRGLADFKGLNPADTVRFSAVASQLFRVLQSAYIQCKDGALEEELWIGFEQSMYDALTHRGLKDWWLIRERWFGMEFRNLINNHPRNSATSNSIYPTLEQT